MSRQPREKALAEILGGMIPELKPRGGKKLRKLREAWGEAVGRERAGYTQVKLLRRGLLHIEVESSALLQELMAMGRERIVARMQEKLGKEMVRDIRLKLYKE